MTLKPKYLPGFAKTFAKFFGLMCLLGGVIPILSGHSVAWSEVIGTAVVAGAFFGIGVCVMFTPREISWGEYTLSVRGFLMGSRDFEWRQLRAYSGWTGRFSLFLLKLEGEQTYQIDPACFDPDEWRAFQEFLRTRFPEKKTWIWLGLLPLRFGRK